jgi:hypothetical protein
LYWSLVLRPRSRTLALLVVTSKNSIHWVEQSMEVFGERLRCQGLSNSWGPTVSYQHALEGNRGCETVLLEYVDTTFLSFNNISVPFQRLTRTPSATLPSRSRARAFCPMSRPTMRTTSRFHSFGLTPKLCPGPLAQSGW